MEIRSAVKGLVTTEDSKILFVAGKRGMWNLIGGGIDPGETADQAFMREIEEEVTGMSRSIDSPRRLFDIEGKITTAEGVHKLARWTVFKTGLIVPFKEIAGYKSNEITAVTSLTPDECFASRNMSDLAKLAVAKSLKM